MARARRFLESKWARLTAWALLVLSLVLSVAVSILVRNQSQCVKDWADASMARTERITAQTAEVAAATQRRDALLADLITNAIAGRKATKPQLAEYVAAKVSADKAVATYRQALASNPVPPAPKYAC